MFSKKIFFRRVKLHDYYGYRPDSPRNVEQGLELQWQEWTFKIIIVLEKDMVNLKTLDQFCKFAVKQLKVNPVSDVPDPQLYAIKISPGLDGIGIIQDEASWQAVLHSPLEHDLTVGFMDTASSPVQWGEEEPMAGTGTLPMDLQLETISNLHDRVKTLEKYLV